MNETTFFQTRYHEVHAYQHTTDLEAPAGLDVAPGEWVVLPNDSDKVMVMTDEAFRFLFRPEMIVTYNQISENTD
jgi:hypothetical protein